MACTGAAALHALYYLAEAAGLGAGYRFQLIGGVVWSTELEEDRAWGRARRLDEKAFSLVREALRMVCGAESKTLEGGCAAMLVRMAKLHYIATRIYPPVGDPVEYYLALHPGADRGVVERVFQALLRLRLV